MRWVIIDYAKRYEISKSGEVRNRFSGKILKQFVKTGGYKYVCFKNNQNKIVNKRVHRIVAIFHIANSYNYTDVNHIDCNKLNNHADNLEWCTRKQNIIHFYNSLTQPRIRGKYKKKSFK